MNQGERTRYGITVNGERMEVTLRPRNEEAARAAGVVCPRCRRIATGWPLRRADVCAPRGWASCLREPATIAKQAAARSEEVRS